MSPSPLLDVSRVLLLLLPPPPPPNIVGGGARIAEIARARDGNAARAGAAAVVQPGSCDRRYLNSCSRRDIDEEVDADEDDDEVLCEWTVDGALGSDAEDENWGEESPSSRYGITTEASSKGTHVGMEICDEGGLLEVWGEGPEAPNDDCVAAT